MDLSDSGFQEQSNIAGPSNTKGNTSEKYSNGNIDKHISPIAELSNTSKSCIDLTEFSSDSDDEDNGYYVTTVWDISDMETLSPSPVTASSPTFNMEGPCIIADNIEILEENNNDPNNNLSFIEIPQESANATNINKISKDQTHKIDCSRESRSPIPGCSKDVDMTDSFKTNNLCPKIHKEAVLIFTLLPNIEFDLITRTLKKNQYAKNYIELTLLDLLHEKKPVPQISKRKQTDDVCVLERKRPVFEEFGIVSNEVQTNDTDLTETCVVSLKEEENSNTNESTNSKSLQSCEENNKTQFEEYKLSTVKDTCLEKPHSLLTQNTISDECSLGIRADDSKDTMPEVQEIETVSNTESKTLDTHSPIIRPAKLIVPKSVPQLLPQLVTCNNNVILAPAKLAYISNYDIKVTDNDKSLSPVQNIVPMQFTNKVNTHIQNDNICEDIVNTTINNTSQNSIYCVKEVQKSRLLFDSETPFKFSENINKVNSDTASNLVSSSFVSVFKNTDTSKDNKILINNPDISEQSTKFVPLLNNDLTLPSTSKNITKERCIDIATDLHTAQGESSINVLSTSSTTSIKSILELTQSRKSTLTAPSATKIPKTTTEDIRLTPKMKRIYYKLLPIFPHVNPDYIKSICAYNNISQMNVDESVQLNTYIEHLLAVGNMHPRVVNIESEPTEAMCDVNKQYENLLEIFPDADPTYLRDIVERIYNKPEELKAFVLAKLENHDYPTREQYLAKTKITEQQKQYTTEFRIDKFLEIFPDPFTYFENPQRKFAFDSIAYEFLKHYYGKLRVNTILREYWNNKHHLSLTARTLDNFQPDMKGKRSTSYLTTEDIPLLQEITFIRHKREIAAYLRKLKEEEATEFKRLKENNALLECQCCFDNECMPSKCSSCDNGHIFCNACIMKGTELKLAESETHIYCFVNCKSEFNLSILQKVLSPTTFSILLQKRQEAEVVAAGLEGLVSCPFCYFASIPPPEDKVFKCFNPDCMKETCRLCKELNHVPLSCDEANSEKARHYLEEKMTQALIHTCYKCSRPFFKEEGCNKMVCVCGALMCYICDKPVNGYKHFRGQGSTQTDLCPLWSDNRVINAKAVLQVAQETEKEIKKKNPNVKLITKPLLPTLPRKSKGPHEDIPHSDVIPARAYNNWVKK